MDMGTALVVIAGIGAFYQLRSQRIRHGGDGGIGLFGSRHRDNAPPHTAADSPREAELQQEVEALRERIHVLERIATDANTTKRSQGRALADEIESLRER